MISDISSGKNNFKEYKHLFHKYYLNLKNPNDNVKYNIEYIKLNLNLNKVLCIHCYDLSNIEHYFNDLISEYNSLEYTIIVTFSIGNDVINDYFLKLNSLIILKIKNKGADIGAKLVTMQYLKDINLEYKFALFVHSKTDNYDRENYLKPFINRCNLLEYIFENDIDCIFPDYNNICICENTNKQCINELEKYYDEFCLYFKIKSHHSNFIFNGTNTFALSKKFIDLLSKNIKILYNNLNEENDFDYNWYKIYYNLHDLSVEDMYKVYLTKKNIGNDFYLRYLNKTGIQNGCYEHIFERMWISILQHYNCNFIALPSINLKSFYNIKVNSIYFPQFHNSTENNNFWGEGFTEWTLLKPFPNNIVVRNNEIQIMKPHDDIGYYSLDNPLSFIKQINTAKTYNIDGFMIYHYWFGNSKSVLNKIEEHILNGFCDFSFCFSWANEPWTNQWEGRSQNDDLTLIEQNYEDDENTEHINYLLHFFKNPNYIKNEDNECLFYIYNYHHLKNNFEKISKKWLKIANENNIKIKFITTINANPENKLNGTPTKYLFTPLSQNTIWKSYPKSNLLSSNGKFIKELPWHMEINYEDLIKDIKLIKNINNLHLGLPLNWNNIVRKKNKPHLNIINYNITNLEKMLYVLISKIITKYKNKLSLNSIEKYNVVSVNIDENNFNLNENIIIVNAWNEWNEQAILEPNNITGYSNLELINRFFEKI